MMSKLLGLIQDNENPSSLSAGLRKKRFSEFVKLLRVSGEEKILDVGGTPNIWIGSGYEENITLLNLTGRSDCVDKHGIRHLKGDACNMHMFGDKSFDIAFSNSVIEHVGDFEKQKRFANEVRRVGKKYWVQTPNKHFPVEPHLLFPFFQYMPGKLQEFVGLNWKYSHIKKWYKSREDILEAIHSIRLLTESEMRELFSDSKIYKEAFFKVTKSFVAYKNDV